MVVEQNPPEEGSVLRIMSRGGFLSPSCEALLYTTYSKL